MRKFTSTFETVRGKKRPRLLTFIDCYLPGYKGGGPLRTISNMVEQLNKEFQFFIVTRDRDYHDQSPYSDILVNNWNTVGFASVYYASPDRFNLWSIAKLMRETPHEVLYLNSFFNPYTTGIPLLARWLKIYPTKPVVVAPRGEFSKGALALKTLKKKFYINAVRASGIYKGLIWQASSRDELIDIQRTMGTSSGHIVVAPDLVQMNDSSAQQLNTERELRQTGPLRIVFLSRISPKKNLDYLVRVLQRVTVTAEFNIYGPDDDHEYWKECQKLMKMLPENIVAAYHGAVVPSKVSTVFKANDVFVFPTRGENYGHVIFESLSAGTAVIISNLTPWKADDAGACQVISLHDFNGYVAAIQSMASLSDEQFADLRNAARIFARRNETNADTLKANLELFNSVIREESILKCRDIR